LQRDGLSSFGITRYHRYYAVIRLPRPHLVFLRSWRCPTILREWREPWISRVTAYTVCTMPGSLTPGLSALLAMSLCRCCLLAI